MSEIAKTPEPPYYAVIFTSHRTEGDNGYGEEANKMVKLASKQPGFLGVKLARESVGIGVQSFSVSASLENILPPSRPFKASRPNRIKEMFSLRLQSLLSFLMIQVDLLSLL